MRWPVSAAAAVVGILLLSSGAAAGVALSLESGPGGRPQVAAVVTDDSGEPVEGATVAFRARTAFGWLPLGEVTTDASGRAVLALPSGRPYPEIEAEVSEPPQRAALTLAERPAWRPAVRPGRQVLQALSPQPGLISPYPVPPLALLGALLGGIWATYGYIVFLLTRIATGR
ncbi:MAG: hypothetical protein QN173_07910 [Armatimonadota bacterium]|nr:hypothetical protein [Armatimonadota bacterium]MDR7402130.1 hypothetical protein [Armatimonadota bacterium]MDR7404107.1 hypothetical protein [Armatimonadota bacterium]MDR7437698.1 hypothetical protein [Armatimonadota bacterium]MDR7472389.1 hypothetical protein [Armatimonadota bacterium]